jgi:hypothetical protein
MDHLVTFDDNGYLTYDSQGHAPGKAVAYGKFKFSIEKGTYSIANPTKRFLR